jgi:hypothetical protein
MSGVARAVTVAGNPAAAPAPRERPLRPVEVAPTRDQRRARPRALAATIAVSGVFVILLAQLMLSIQLSEGAYRITAAEGQLVELNRSAQVLSEDLARLESPQNLAAQAESLGMVVNSSSAYLRLADAAVLGTPVAASAQSGVLDGRDSIVGNVLLVDVPLVVPASAGEASGVAPTPSSPGPLA